MKVLKQKWKVLEGGDVIEDMSIVTLDGEEVVGCSEWMRAEREVFDHIVKLHNNYVMYKGELNDLQESE